ncbi:MAG: sensor histidine kinase [Chloroflexi bacterium]|nr:sensor histidine kinase [Chloroflexota bacterium]
MTKAGFQTFCAIPLLYQNELSGVLTVAAMSQELFQQPRDLRLLEGIGERLAVAIENARLHQQVQELAILQERERIAREMHDGMAQLLGYINTQTIAVRKFLSEGALEEARTALANMEEVARDLYADVREGILGLRTSSSRTNGLLPVLREYAEHYTQMCGIAVAIHSSDEGGDLRLPAASEIQLTRIIQEALTNVRKHSKASTAEVTMEQRNGELTVTIADNGQGFDPAHLPLKGWPRFGLQTMRERAEAIGGTLAVHSAPGAGATIEVHIPLPR